ncbi:MAG: calcium-binding protein [Microcoleaceae cyanobacterium]
MTDLFDPDAGLLQLALDEIINLGIGDELTLEEASQLFFSPDPDFEGEASFSYTATDENGVESEEATVTIDVEGASDILRDGIEGGIDCVELVLAELSNIPVISNPTPEASEITSENSDFLSGDDGNNEIFGIAGSDTIVGDTGESGSDTLSGADILYGNTEEDLIAGYFGDDLIHTGQSDDWAYGGQGNDRMWGDQGSDTMLGDRGNDILIGDTEIDPSELTLESNIPHLDRLIGGAGADIVIGNYDNDTLQGGDGNDILHGGRDDDRVHGDAGDDLLFGDSGNDILCGDEDNDTLFGDQVFVESEEPTVGADTLCGGAGDDLLLANVGDDLLCGHDGNDTLYGGLGNDTLVGGSGENLFFGDAGDDLMSGGESQDQFVLFADDGTDTITNFQVGLDVIVLSGGLSFDQLTVEQDGTSAVVSLDGEVLVVLNSVNSAVLTADNFTTDPS